jgi:hypothetical protein
MRDWIFLIQKAGDRNWQSIQTPILEVEEGKYRLIGQTDRSDLCVEVRVHVEPLEASSDSETRQTYFRRTNSQGLIIILPFTHFHAGLWEFSCGCDAMSELMGEKWRVSRQIFSVPKAGYLGLPPADPTACPQGTKFDSPEPTTIEETRPLASATAKILPPKLNLSSERIARKSPQLPKFSS